MISVPCSSECQAVDQHKLHFCLCLHRLESSMGLGWGRWVSAAGSSDTPCVQAAHVDVGEDPSADSGVVFL